MAETILVMEDQRLEDISAQIIRLANADFRLQGTLSDKGDELDSIVVGLNLLGEELESYTNQLKESEEKIKNTLMQLTEAQHISHIGSWEWDVTKNLVSWTEELYRIYGRNKENFESNFENFLICIHPEDREYVDSIIQNSYREKKPFSFLHRIISPDGMEKTLDCKGNVYTDEHGAVIKMTGTAQDITELKKAQEKVMQLAAIVESSSDAIFSKNIEGFILSWNKQAEKLFGYTEKEILGKHISLLFPLNRLNEEEKILNQIKKGHPIINYETERRKKNGTNVFVEGTISPIKDPNGKIIGISNIFRDITEKKQAEEKLNAYTVALEHKNKETEQFAYIASHDLQEPLRTITNYIGLFREEYEGKLDKSADIYLRSISGASERMQTLITDLLEYTRIESDNNQIEIDCNVLLSEVMKDMEKAITENNAIIQFETLPVITGYFSRFKSLFQNLISNGIKFKRKGIDPIIKITAKDTGKEWLFEVKDNGIGMEKIYYDKIFMIFQRLHSRSEYQGTGIGLAHCKKIIDLRGGKIWVESEINQGSSFYFTVPKTIII